VHSNRVLEIALTSYKRFALASFSARKDKTIRDDIQYGNLLNSLFFYCKFRVNKNEISYSDTL